MAKTRSSAKVAIVYDWLDTQYGGAEKVLQALQTAFPNAPLYTSVVAKNSSDSASFANIRSSFLQRLPLRVSKPRYLVPLLPLAFESLDLSEFETVITVTSAFAKGIVTRADQLHLCYLLTPPRYLYSHKQEYLDRASRWSPLRWVINQGLEYLAWWDQAAAHRPDAVVPISNLVAARCQKYYGRSADAVVYPPVEPLSKLPLTTLEAAQLKNLPAKYAVVVSRLVGYKRIDVAISACLELQVPLIIIGEGEERSKLEALAAGNSLISFWGSQSAAVVSQVVGNSNVLLMPGIEDFGITAAEAVASGVPVIVHRESGVSELLQDGKTAVFMSEMTVKNTVSCLEEVFKRRFQSEYLRKSMRKYITSAFVQQMQDIVSKLDKSKN